MSQTANMECWCRVGLDPGNKRWNCCKTGESEPNPEHCPSYVCPCHHSGESYAPYYYVSLSGVVCKTEDEMPLNCEGEAAMYYNGNCTWACCEPIQCEGAGTLDPQVSCIDNRWYLDFVGAGDLEGVTLRYSRDSRRHYKPSGWYTYDGGDCANAPELLLVSA